MMPHCVLESRQSGKDAVVDARQHDASLCFGIKAKLTEKKRIVGINDASLCFGIKAKQSIRDAYCTTNCTSKDLGIKPPEHITKSKTSRTAPFLAQELQT